MADFLTHGANRRLVRVDGRPDVGEVVQHGFNMGSAYVLGIHFPKDGLCAYYAQSRVHDVEDSEDDAAASEDEAVVPPNALKLLAGRLHHRYLNGRVMVPSPDGNPWTGHLQAFKLRNVSAAEDYFGNYEVTLWISDRELSVRGDTYVTFLDEVAEERPA